MASRSNCVKFMISMPADIFSKVEDYAVKNGLNRSAFISQACAQYITAQESAIFLRQQLASSLYVTADAVSGTMSPSDALTRLDDISASVSEVVSK